MPAEVFGRDAELQTLATFLDGLPAGPGACILAGDAGAGKTTLLRAAAALAAERGWTVLRTAPTRGDLRLAFAGLTDLLESCLDDFIADLPPPRARALRVALLLEEAPPYPPDPRAIAAAFRGAVTSLSKAGPILLAIDDLQWLDAPSEQAVGFTMRRMESEPVGLLCAQRTARPGRDLPLELGRAQLPVKLVPVGGLSPGALHRMLRSTLGTSFPHPVMLRIAAGSGGNPFIALEIGRALVRRGNAAMADRSLPVPETLSELVNERLGTLPAAAVAAMQLVAVLPDARVEQYLGCGVDAAALDTGVRMAVLEQSAGRLKFAHPLLAAAVAAATPQVRSRELHAAAAAIAQLPEERARHRALATIGPSAAVARELAAAADEAAARGAPAVAAELLELAASRTPAEDQQQADRYRVGAARMLALAGDATAAVAALTRLAAAMPHGPERSDALCQLGLLREHDYPEAAGLMELALAEAGSDALRTASIRISLADIWAIRGDSAKGTEVARQAVRDAERAGHQALLGSALARVFEFELIYGPGADETKLHRALALERAAEPLDLLTPPSWTAGEYYACFGRFDDAEAEFRKLLSRAEADGVEYWRAHSMRYLATISVLRGDARRAAELSASGLEIAEQLDFPHSAATLLYIAALAALQLGQQEAVTQLADRGLRLAEQTGEPAYVVLHKALPGSLELARGDAAAAAAHLRPLAGQLHVIGLRPTVPALAADVAAALVGSGAIAEATQFLAERERVSYDPLSAALLPRGRGLIAAARGDLGEAVVEFTEALQRHSQVSAMPLERGRTLLALGVVQRRLNQRATARATLAEAAAIFAEITAPFWAARTSAELARISGRSPGPEDLTSTEQRVAELVARGLSNREVAAELFVTVRAVESTLTKVYAKLGVRSRTELAAQLRG